MYTFHTDESNVPGYFYFFSASYLKVILQLKVSSHGQSKLPSVLFSANAKTIPREQSVVVHQICCSLCDMGGEECYHYSSLCDIKHF